MFFKGDSKLCLGGAVSPALGTTPPPKLLHPPSQEGELSAGVSALRGAESSLGDGILFLSPLCEARLPSTAVELEQLPSNSDRGANSGLSDCGLDPCSV